MRHLSSTEGDESHADELRPKVAVKMKISAGPSLSTDSKGVQSAHPGLDYR